jgi:hypothetical protein
LCSKNSINLSVFIPPFSYKSQFTTPFTEIANTPVYFLNTSWDSKYNKWSIKDEIFWNVNIKGKEFYSLYYPS